MAEVVIIKDRCKGCELCIGACPKGVLGIPGEMNKFGYRYVQPVEAEKCIGCALCATMCPDGAIEVYKED